MGTYTILLAGLFLGFLSTAAAADEAAVPLQQEQAKPADLLGAGDQVSIWILGLSEISDKPLLVDDAGGVDLPVIGRVRAANTTLAQFRTELLEKAKQYVRDPQVSVSLVQSGSRPVTVVGAVNSPGMHQMQGHKTVIEMLSLAGGLRPDAGYSITITRKRAWGKIPVDGAIEDEAAGTSVAHLKTSNLLKGINPSENISVQPYDVISVPRAELVYVVGDVQKAGGFTLNEKETITILQALSLAGGLSTTAAPSAARVLREEPGRPERTETIVNLKNILSGKRGDEPLRSGDILFVPSSASKSAGKRALDTALQLAVGVAIFHR